MSKEPRTHDEDQRERRDEDRRDSRPGPNPRNARPQESVLDRPVPEPLRERDDDGNVVRSRPHDYIERTKPEDPVDRPGQLTRDNVNPNIPSVSPDQVGPPNARVSNPGGIVDPNTLGMDQGQHGVTPPQPETQVEQWPSLGLDHTKNADDQVQEAENRQRQAEEGASGLGEAPRMHSINEPPGSDILPGEGGPNALPDGAELPPLVLTDIDPDSTQTGSPDVTLTVTGSGFTPSTVIVFDDEELPTTFVDQTTMTANLPSAAEAATVDVEVHRGEEMSDVLTFEFVAPAGTRSREKAERKPKKNEPRHKRNKQRRAR